MASMGRRSEEKAESSYDRDPSSQHQFYQHQRSRHPAHHNNPPYPSSNNPYQHDPLPPGQPLYQQHTMPPPSYPPNGNGIDINTNGNYNSVNNSNNNNPVPPRMRMRKCSDMTRTIWHYERIEQIGEGTYGQVYRARCKDTNEIVAMKKIRVHHGAHWGMPPTVIREIKILKRLVHPNLVRMHEVVSSKGVEHLDANDYHKGSDRSRKNKHKSGVGGHGGADNNGKDNNNSTKNDNNNNSTSNKIDISDAREGYKGNLFLVLEYVPHDLTGLLDVAYKFSEVEIKCVFRQLLEALRYMHDQKYVHRDIKSSNILIDRNFRLKLADFGLARSIEPPLLDNLHERGSSQEFTNKVITLWYRPPELLLGATRYGFAVDIWSAGCILAELVLGRPLFTGKTDMEQLQLIFDMVGTPTSKSWPGIRDLKLLRTGDVSIDGDKNRKRPKLRERYQTKMNNIAPGAINLVEKLLELDPSKRLTASRALNHRYFLQEPRAPDQPEALGEMNLAEGGSFHEFQTKKKRKEAKAEAEKIKQAALDGGHTTKQAQEEYDACYRGIMEKVAREGLDSLSTTNNSAKTAANETTEGENNRELSEKKIEDRHSSKHRSSRSDRSLDLRNGSSKSSRDKDHRDSSSRGRDRRTRERESGSSSKQDVDTEAESGSTHRDRGHDRERSRSSRRTSESDDRRKKKRRESSGEDAEKSSRRDRDKEKERHREHRKSSKDESGGKADGINNKTENSTVDLSKNEKSSNEIVATEETKKNESSKPKDSIDNENGGKKEEITTQPSQPKQEKDKNEPPRGDPTGTDKPDKNESKPNQEKQPASQQQPRSTSSRDEKKRGDRSRDRMRDDDARKDRRDRDRDHHRRSSKDRDGRTRDSSIKKRKSRTRSRSAERDRSPGRSRDDRHHRHRRDRDHPRRERDRDRDRRPDDLRDMDRRFRNDGHPHPDDWGPGMGSRGPPPGMQRRGGDFPNGNPDFGGPRPDHHPRGGDFGPYGGGDRGPAPRGGGPGGFHGPPGRHPGPGGGNNRGAPHGGGRPPPPMDYYPPGGDHPPPGFRDRDRGGPRRDRDRR